MSFNPLLWEVIDQVYDEEWEAYLRPHPHTGFDWKYVVFDGDKCVNCPIIWTANAKVTVTGLQVKLMSGHIFTSASELDNIAVLIAGDILSLDNLVIPRS